MLGVGLALLAIVVLLALIAPLITSSGPRRSPPPDRCRPPGGAHLLGTDRNAFDVWSRLLGAARIDLGIAVIAVFFAVARRHAVGVVVGFVGGWLEEGTMGLSTSSRRSRRSSSPSPSPPSSAPAPST